MQRQCFWHTYFTVKQKSEQTEQSLMEQNKEKNPVHCNSETPNNYLYASIEN